MEKKLNSRQVAEMLGVTAETICTWVKKRGLPAQKVNRKWSFDLAALEEWQRSVQAAGAPKRGITRNRREKVKYAMGFSAGALMLVQSVEVAELRRNCSNWDDTKSRALSMDLFQTRSAATNARYCSEIVNRLTNLNDEELELLCSGAPSDQKNIL